MYTGHALSHDKFDATFFNIPFSYPSVMDPLMKKCLEISVEAVIDAGLSSVLYLKIPRSANKLDQSTTLVYEKTNPDCLTINR